MILQTVINLIMLSIGGQGADCLQKANTGTGKQNYPAPLWRRCAHPIRSLTPLNEKDTRGVVVETKCI